MQISIQRVYDPVATGEGRRVLVDRVWPRGISHEKASWDEWCKDVAPSTALREWFGHDPGKWEMFRNRYRDELSHLQPEVDHLLSLAEQGSLTLLYGAKDTLHNQAVVLRDYLLEHTDH